jgi:GNAT superfamily N-acetyltransferase
MTTNVRPATRGDLQHLVEWNAAMALETEDKVLDRAVLERGVAGVFDDPRRGFYLVAERDARPVGSLLVTFEWSDWRCGDWWWIQSVYVPPAARRLGVFRALYDAVERRARATPGVVGLRLYVEGGNEKAQQTYENLGMTASSYRFFARGFLDGT